jgi:membrane-associated protease RseP (regulator of RpoE activity)
VRWVGAGVRHRYWLHVVLLLATLLTTTAMGARLAQDFEQNVPPFSGGDLDALWRFREHPETLLAGLPFSATLLVILLAHELGHFFACVYYRVNASLPYFLPAPTLIGTFGAFIRIRSPIYSRPMLFDIGIAGPLAGFLFLLPALAIGLAYSKVIPNIATQGDFVFGVPLLQRLLEALIFPGTPAADIYLHPIARAAWVGLLATALNLLPIGQLDGGHILYSFAGVWHKTLSRIFVAALAPIGLLYSYTWLLWALFLFLFGMRHPVIYDPAPLRRGRRRLGLLALLIFLLSFTLAPVSLGEGVL